MSSTLEQAIADLAKATADHAKATRELNELHERLWLALPPRTRAAMLGISSRAEWQRRKKAELKKLCEA